MTIGIQNAAGTSEKTKDPSLHKGNTGSQTVDYGLLPTGVDSYELVQTDAQKRAHIITHDKRDSSFGRVSN